MKKIITTNRIPIKLWLEDIDHLALAQAENIANLPFACQHIAIMPDSHVGYGMPIGAVLCAKDVIIPNAVGVDIGCGMCAVRTSLREISPDALKEVMGMIRKAVPLGFDHHKTPQDKELMPDLVERTMPIVVQQYNKALHQIGTLGGGNHFIEIQQGDDGHVWIMIHSGSRNLGHTVANHYNKVAERLNEAWHVQVPREWQLAFLPIITREAKEYMAEMSFCIEFALANRTLMMERVQEALADVVGQVEYGEMVNKSHNFAAWEYHGTQDVLVHRKGATRVRKDEQGLIPGSQGTASYIVRGLGNAESFDSCSHGAGRRMGRKQAIRELDFDTEKARLDALGVIHAIRGRNDLEEAPGAYKDIDQVMENQCDLVEIVVKLRPLAVVKG
ncbi:MAG TPA: RtcB family protein [Desulfobulbaceae bacterium]|nr:MAG: RNA-splicing ligase RtcB [Deltaproteobacteria bacterium RIFOXYD12_FULL_53_23]HCC53466.1 RtcB family protein [Desulfobulbaceae bacterium]